jgi:hypothetical protein
MTPFLPAKKKHSSDTLTCCLCDRTLSFAFQSILFLPPLLQIPSVVAWAVVVQIQAIVAWAVVGRTGISEATSPDLSWALPTVARMVMIIDTLYSSSLMVA